MRVVAVCQPTMPFLSLLGGQPISVCRCFCLLIVSLSHLPPTTMTRGLPPSCLPSLSDKGSECLVLHVKRKDAKRVKTLLEADGVLDKSHRMTPSVDKADCIAIPIVLQGGDEKDGKGEDGSPVGESPWQSMVVSTNRQFCMYSTAKMGNQGLRRHNNDLTLPQQALLECCCRRRRPSRDMAGSKSATSSMPTTGDSTEQTIRSLPIDVCPKKLEYIGDDKTLVIPRKALRTNVLRTDWQLTIPNENDLWQELARLHNSPRVVRRGDIDPNSSVRESGHVLLWPFVPATDAPSGPSSPGWITVTEHGIRQSFDLTRVMFSRGNVTEKKRFGRLVQPGETVLDMYAGIGYYTLPAILLGKARYVHACEWNPHAVAALRYNLQQNGVSDDQYRVHPGDCRVSIEEQQLVGIANRVSLGLLPSSEGGWGHAVRALHRETGGWLHIHANVPVTELRLWTEWMVHTLFGHCQDCNDRNTSDWVVACANVEKVKSFAPTINHYVADVYCGPNDGSVNLPNMTNNRKGDNNVWLREHGGAKVWTSIDCPPLNPPSCALNDDGVLHQAWMR